MEKKLMIKRGTRLYKFLASDLSHATYTGKEAKHDTLRTALRFIDQGYKVEATFSLEALYLQIRDELKREVSEEILLEQTLARKPERMTDGVYPKWTHYKIDPPQEWNGEKIKALRKKMRASVASFAKLFGVSSSNVNEWEAGNAIPKKSSWRLFDIFDYDPWAPMKFGFMTLIPKKDRPRFGPAPKPKKEVEELNGLHSCEEEIQKLLSSLLEAIENEHAGN